jgi:hypothetical protein
MPRWWWSGSSRSPGSSLWRGSIGRCINGMPASTLIKIIHNSLYSFTENSLQMGVIRTTLILAIKTRASSWKDPVYTCRAYKYCVWMKCTFLILPSVAHCPILAVVFVLRSILTFLSLHYTIYVFCWKDLETICPTLLCFLSFNKCCNIAESGSN